MANKKKVFSKAEWLKSANADLAAGGGMTLRDDWFIEVGDDGGGDA